MGLNYSYLILLIVAFVGLTVGSFLNVVIDRLPEKKTIVKGRSMCDYCRRELDWWEMVPVLSYFFLRGRCRTCGEKLSVQYPVVELLVGLLTLFFYIKFISPTLSSILIYQDLMENDWWSLIVRIKYAMVYWLSLYVFVISLIAIAVIDIKKGIIPDELIIFSLFVYAVRTMCIFIIGGLTVINIDLFNESSLYFQQFVSTQVFYPILYGFLVALAFYLLIVITRGRGMGGGDVKLAFVIGLFLVPSNFFLAIYLAFVTGGLIALLMLLVRVRKLGQTIPFGPFLVLGTILSLFYGEVFLKIYLDLVL